VDDLTISPGFFPGLKASYRDASKKYLTKKIERKTA